MISVPNNPEAQVASALARVATPAGPARMGLSSRCRGVSDRPRSIQPVRRAVLRRIDAEGLGGGEVGLLGEMR